MLSNFAVISDFRLLLSVFLSLSRLDGVHERLFHTMKNQESKEQRH